MAQDNFPEDHDDDLELTPEEEDLIANELADGYRESLKAGEGPNFQDYLDVCPNDRVRNLVKALCNFENLLDLAFRLPFDDPNQGHSPN